MPLTSLIKSQPDETAKSSSGMNDTFCIGELKQITEESREKHLLELEELKNEIIKCNQIIDHYIREYEATGSNITWMQDAIKLFKGEEEQLNTIYLERDRNTKKQLKNDQIRIARLERIKQMVERVETTTTQEIEESSPVTLRQKGKGNQKQDTDLGIAKLEALNRMEEKYSKEIGNCEKKLAELKLNKEKILVDESNVLKIQHDTSQVVADKTSFLEKGISTNEAEQKKIEYKLKHIGKMDTNVYPSTLQKSLDVYKQSTSSFKSQLEALKSRKVESEDQSIKEKINEKKENITKEIATEEAKFILLTNKLIMIKEIIKMETIEIKNSHSLAKVELSRNVQIPTTEMTEEERKKKILFREELINLYQQKRERHQESMKFYTPGVTEVSQKIAEDMEKRIEEETCEINIYMGVPEEATRNGMVGLSCSSTINKEPKENFTLKESSSQTIQATKEDSNAQISKISLNAQSEEFNLRRTGAIRKKKPTQGSEPLCQESKAPKSFLHTSYMNSSVNSASSKWEEVTPGTSKADQAQVDKLRELAELKAKNKKLEEENKKLDEKLEAIAEQKKLTQQEKEEKARQQLARQEEANRSKQKDEQYQSRPYRNR